MKGIISKKIEILGGLTSYNPNTAYTNEQLAVIKQQVRAHMQALPEEDVMDFVATYGGSVFQNEVLIPITEKPDFLSGNVPVKAIIGFASSPSVTDYINQYYHSQQLAVKFFPVFEGLEGDLIFYSLESHTEGAIYYWHRNGEASGEILLLSRSFGDFIAALYSHKEEEAITLDITV